MSAIPFSGTYGTYEKVFTELGDGKFSLGDITAPAAAGLDVLGWLCDPIGSLASAALGPLLDWLASQFPPLQEALDKLTGDIAAIQAYSQEWMAIANAVVSAGNHHAATANDLGSWHQAGAAEYHEQQKAINQAFQGVATQCTSVSNSVNIAGEVCAGVRGAIWGLVRDFITSVIGNALAALALSVGTAGGSVAAFASWFSGKLAWVMGKVTGWLHKLFAWLSKAVAKFQGLSATLDKAAAALKKMSRDKFRQAGGFSSAASKKTGGRLKVTEIDKPALVTDSAKKVLDPFRERAGKIVEDAENVEKAAEHMSRESPKVNQIP